MIRAGVCTVMILALLPVTAAAQQPDPTEPIPLDSVLVVVQRADGAATATVLTEEAVEQKHAPLVYDALTMQPGLHLVKRVGLTGSGLSRLAIRGAGVDGPAGLQVYVDGRPDPTVSFAHPIPQAYHTADLEQVEVIHGPSPVLHGSGNTGVINIRRARPRPGWAGQLTVSGGSYGTSENFAHIAHGWERGWLAFNSTYQRTDGHNPDSDAWIAAAGLRGGYEIDDRWRVSFHAAQTRDHFDVNGSFFVPGPFGNPGQSELDLTQTVGDVKLEGRFDALDLSVQLWGDDLDPRNQVTPDGADRADVREIGARLKAALAPWPAGALILGVDVLDAAADNRPAIPPNAPRFDVSITEVGPYAFLEQRLGPAFTVNGGVRITSHSEYGTEPSGEVGLLFFPAAGRTDSPLRGTALRARATRGFQSPTMQQLFGVFRGGTGGPANPDLEPERVAQLELGLHQAFATWAADVVVFAQSGENVIIPVAGELRNSGEFDRSGVEAQLVIRPVEALTFNAGLTWYDLGEDVLRIPYRTFDAGLLYEFGVRSPRDLDVSIEARHASNLYDQAPQGARVRLDDYFVVDGKLLWEVRPGVRPFLALDNIFNEEYETVLGIPMPGLSAYAGVSVEF